MKEVQSDIGRGQPNVCGVLKNSLSDRKGISSEQGRIQDFREGASTPEGSPTYNLTNFSRKVHENEEFLAQRNGGRASPALLDPPLHTTVKLFSLTYETSLT